MNILIERKSTYSSAYFHNQVKICKAEKEIERACERQREGQRQRETVSETEKKIANQRKLKTQTEIKRNRGIDSRIHI